MSRSPRDKKEEILGILLLAIGTLALFSLLPKFLVQRLSGPEEAEYLNLVGLAGKFINESAKDLLGVLAYALPVLLIVWGWRIFRGRASMVYRKITVFVLVIGFGLSTVLGLRSRGLEAAPGDFGAGELGSRVAGFLDTTLGSVGAWVATTAALLIFLIFYTGLSLRVLTEGLLSAVSAVAGAFRWSARKISAGRSKPKKGRKTVPGEAKTADTRVSVRSDSLTEAAVPAADRSGEPEDFDFSLELNAGPEEDRRSARNADSGPVEMTEPELEKRPLFGAAAAGEGESPAYELPTTELLDPVPEGKKVVSGEELQQMGAVLMAKLRDFSVEGELINITRGPQVSTFEIRPAPGVKVNKIAALADDLAMAMHATRVRILAPIPGKGAVGVELPNPILEVVRARDVFESEAFRNNKLFLPIGLGKDLEGRIRVADLTRTPHLLIAGTTGSGKSVCMNMIIASLLFRYGPEQVRLLMIDPKMIELTMFNGIPHLLHPVVTEAKETAGILKWTTFEMERRYRILSRNSVRNIEDFNYKVFSGKPIRPLNEDEADYPPQRMPYIVILVDELSDLMCSEVKNEIEAGLVRLAQMARAVGIHLVVATQRPSVDVITGLIKANFPSRLSFQVYSKIDSRTILDLSGAEQLLRNGDMLFIPSGQADPIRIQGAYLSSGETERLAAHWRSQPVAAPPGEAGRDEEEPGEKSSDILRDLERRESAGGDDDERDELFAEAARLVVRHDLGSTSLIQRRLKVGYARAGRIVDQLERAGILGPPDGSKAREVLIREDELRDYGVG